MTQEHQTPELGISGRIASFFQSAQITPLLALVALLLGIFAVLVTPREEEPQINVTMANVLIPFPGASVRDVEQMVAIPAEQGLSQITGTEHVMSLSRPGMAVLTVQFKVGVPRTEALVRLYDTVQSNADWLPQGLGVQPPTASWGNMLMDGKAVIETAPWLSVYPGLAILVTVLGYNLLGESLRDIFDPRLRQ